MTQTVFSHIGLTCIDPIAVEKFYEKHFGFKRANVYNPGPEQIVMIKSGDVYLELFKATKDSPVADPEGTGPDYKGWRHICFMVDDLEATLAEIGPDAKITRGPVELDRLIQGMKVCWIADPEGNIIELNQGYKDAENFAE